MSVTSFQNGYSLAIDFSNINHIYMVWEPEDLRRGIDGYASVILANCGRDPSSQSLFLFTNRQKNKMKAIFYDGTGFWLLYKRLNSGRFKWNLPGVTSLMEISCEQFEKLMAGYSPYPERGFRVVHGKRI